jgi:hypothetical protein
MRATSTPRVPAPSFLHATTRTIENEFLRNPFDVRSRVIGPPSTRALAIGNRASRANGIGDLGELIVSAPRPRAATREPGGGSDLATRHAAT